MKSLEICYASQTLGMGGAEIFIAELLSELKARKNNVCAYTNFGSFRELLQSRAVPSKRIPVVFDIIGDWKGLFKAIFLLPYFWIVYSVLVWKNRNCDVLLVSGFAEKFPISWWANIFGVPVVWIEFAPLESVLKKFFGLPKLWYRLATTFSTMVITPSEHSKRGLVAEGILKAEQLAVIPCGRNLAALKNVRFIKNKEVICISRMEAGKGQDLLVRAFRGVVQKIPEAHLTLVGEGNFVEQVRSLIASLNLGSSVTITGRVHNALQLLKNAKVCVTPSVWPLEGFGLVACEGMAFGKPVVAFDHGPINEIVVHNKTGLLAKDGNIAELSDYICAVLSDEELSLRLGTAGLSRFTKNYTMESIAKKYEEFLQNICTKK